MATPDEVSKMLYSAEERHAWDVQMEDCVPEEGSENALKIKYSYKAGRTRVTHKLFKSDDDTYIVQENFKCLSSQVESGPRIYLIEEIKNRPFFVRVTVYQANMQSEHEGRALLVAMSSFQNALGMGDRQKQVMPSLSVFNRKKTQNEEIENRLLLGMTSAEGIADVSEEEGSLAGSEQNSSMGAIPEVDSDDSEDQTKLGISYAESTVIPMRRTQTNQVDDSSKNQMMESVAQSNQERPDIDMLQIVDDLTTPTFVRDAEFIEDWPARFKAANYSNEQIRVVQKAQAKMQEWNAMHANDSVWTNMAQDKAGCQLRVDYHTSPRGFNVLKATGIISHNIDYVFKTLVDGVSRLQYDVNIAETKFLKKIAVNTYVGYQKSKKIVIVSERDFVIVQHFIRHKNGDMQIVVFQDDEYESLVPADKNRAIRGSVYVGGWYFEKLSETSTRSTLILEIDIQSRMPTWVIKQSNTQQANQINKLPQVIEQWKRDNE